MINDLYAITKVTQRYVFKEYSQTSIKALIFLGIIHVKWTLDEMQKHNGKKCSTEIIDSFPALHHRKVNVMDSYDSWKQRWAFFTIVRNRIGERIY